MAGDKGIAVAIWRSGLPLEEAAEKHAPKRLLRQLSNIRPPENPSILPGIEMYANTMEEPRKSQFLGSVKDLSGQWTARQAKIKIVTEIKDDLRRKLISGELVAYGYESASPGAPTPLQPYLFEHENFINWHKSSVKGHTLEYLSVKVTAPQLQLETIAPVDEKTIPEKRSKIGRPSSKKRTSEAIWYFDKEEPNFRTLSRKEQIQKVREFILKNYPGEFPGESGLNDNTLGAHICGFIRQS